MSQLPKMGKVATKARTSNPIILWLHDKLTLVKREEMPDKEAVMPLRWADEKASADQAAPAIPGGVHHKLADNYYFGRDARRTVVPPPAIYEQSGFLTLKGQAVPRTNATTAGLGHKANFGLPCPTPGFGHEATRNVANERPEVTATRPEYHSYQSFDKYATDTAH